MDRLQQIERRKHFEGHILDLALHDPIVKRCVDEYSYGSILTREEALSRMVVMLSSTCSNQLDIMTKNAMVSLEPLTRIIPVNTTGCKHQWDEHDGVTYCVLCGKDSS